MQALANGRKVSRRRWLYILIIPRLKLQYETMKDQAKEMSEYRASFDRREPLVEGRVYKDVFLISLVIPGPKAYDDLNSFLSLLVDELKALHDGVPDTYNVYMQTRFTLRGHLLFVSGDGRAVADAMQMSQLGNARRPCRTCEIEAIRGEGHYYVLYDGVLSGTARTNLRNDIRIVEECMSKKKEMHEQEEGNADLYGYQGDEYTNGNSKHSFSQELPAGYDALHADK